MLPVCLKSDGLLKVFMIDVLVSVSQTRSVSKGRFQIALSLAVVISRRQKRVQLMRIREKDAKKRQQAGGQEGTYRRKATPVKRYAGDLLAPVSVSQQGVCCSDFFSILIYLNTSKRLSECVMFSTLLPLHNSCLSVFAVRLLRATCKVCEIGRWEQVLPLAASAPPTRPWSTWTARPDPWFPSQPRLQSSGSDQRRAKRQDFLIPGGRYLHQEIPLVRGSSSRRAAHANCSSVSNCCEVDLVARMCFFFFVCFAVSPVCQTECH